MFFSPEIYSSDFTTPLPEIVDNCIQSAPIDSRRALYKVCFSYPSIYAILSSQCCVSDFLSLMLFGFLKLGLVLLYALTMCNIENSLQLILV